MSLQEILAEIDALTPEDFAVLEQRIKARASSAMVSTGQLIGDLAGSLEDLPRDLSSNPKHLDGFGQ